MKKDLPAHEKLNQNEWLSFHLQLKTLQKEHQEHLVKISRVPLHLSAILLSVHLLLSQDEHVLSIAVMITDQLENINIMKIRNF